MEQTTEIKLVLIGYAPEHNLFRIRARKHGAYVITNYQTNRKEVYAMSERADEAKRELYPAYNLLEKDDKYYFITAQSMIEISAFEFNQLNNKLKQL